MHSRLFSPLMVHSTIDLIASICKLSSIKNLVILFFYISLVNSTIYSVIQPWIHSLMTSKPRTIKISTIMACFSEATWCSTSISPTMAASLEFLNFQYTWFCNSTSRLVGGMTTSSVYCSYVHFTSTPNMIQTSLFLSALAQT